MFPVYCIIYKRAGCAQEIIKTKANRGKQSHHTQNTDTLLHSFELSTGPRSMWVRNAAGTHECKEEKTHLLMKQQKNETN